MDGRNTIIIILESYFGLSLDDDDDYKLDGICDLLLSGLIDEGYEITPSYRRLSAQIEYLVREFSANTQEDLVTVKNDLWTLLVNWWNTVKWARQEVRACNERENLFADIVTHIKTQILNHHNPFMRNNYSLVILQALIQMITPPNNAVDPYLQTLLPPTINLNHLLRQYRRLTNYNGFGNEVHILLKLLYNKEVRNNNSHAKFQVGEYRRYCIGNGEQPSFAGFIRYRGLNIHPSLYDHCERLFRRKFHDLLLV